MSSNLQKRSAVFMILLCGLLCINSAAALSQVATDNGPGIIHHDGETLYTSDLSVWRDGDSSAAYTGDDLTVTLTLTYINGDNLYVDTKYCTIGLEGPDGYYSIYSPDPDESASEASRVNPECNGEEGIIFDANGGEAIICPSGDPVSLVFHIPGDDVSGAGTWRLYPWWHVGTFADTDGTCYDLTFTVNEHNYVPLFTPTYVHIVTPTPTQFYQFATTTPTPIVIVTPVPTNIPSPGPTAPEGIPSPEATNEPTAVATTPMVEQTTAPTEAATATAAATASPGASEVPTTAQTGGATPEGTGIAAGATASVTPVPTETTDTPVPGTQDPIEQNPQGIPFGWIFSLALLIMIVGAGAYFIGTRKNSSIPSEPEVKNPEPEETVNPDDSDKKTE